MATNVKTKKSRAATSRKTVRPLARGRGTSKPGRGSAITRSHGLVARVQTILPSAGRAPRKSSARRVAGALGKATGGTTARAPVTKRIVGVVASGVGAAAVARRRRTHPKRLPETTSAPAVKADSKHRPQRIETTADPSATTGGDHGDPQQPGPATAA